METISQVLREATLKPRERIILSYILSQGQVTLSLDALARELNLGEATIRRAVERLTSMGAIKRSKPRGKPLVYTTNPTSEWRLFK